MVLVNYFTETVTAGTRSLLSNKGVDRQDGDAAGDVPRGLDARLAVARDPAAGHPGAGLPGHRVVGDGPLWVPDTIGMASAFLGFVLIMVYGTAFGLLFSCVNVIFRDFQRIVQTFINMIPFTHRR